MPNRPLRVAALTVAALSLGLSFAHLAEAPPRLWAWSPDLWRQATVFGGQYALFAPLGALLDSVSVLLAGILAWMAQGQRPFRPALAACLLYAVALGTWFAWVAPANAALAAWLPGPLPDDFFDVRDRWESGHAAIALIKLAGFVALAVAATGRAEAPG
jgi:hypothetical protein